ncbi:MAG: hypothetical protein J2P48_01255 [Alphaproteobacteria bacterium]|nr:hypothetical protein [Alphaproteobacteria bacterium]
MITGDDINRARVSVAATGGQLLVAGTGDPNILRQVGQPVQGDGLTDPLVQRRSLPPGLLHRSDRDLLQQQQQANPDIDPTTGLSRGVTRDPVTQQLTYDDQPPLSGIGTPQMFGLQPAYTPPPGEGPAPSQASALDARDGRTDPLDVAYNSIRNAEGGGPYTRYGGGQYDPRQTPTLSGYYGYPQLPARYARDTGLPTHATGELQWQPRTWKWAVELYMQQNPGRPAPDFRNPNDQRRVGKFWAARRYTELTGGRDLARDVARGEVRLACSRAGVAILHTTGFRGAHAPARRGDAIRIA